MSELYKCLEYEISFWSEEFDDLVQWPSSGKTLSTICCASGYNMTSGYGGKWLQEQLVASDRWLQQQVVASDHRSTWWRVATVTGGYSSKWLKVVTVTGGCNRWLQVVTVACGSEWLQ
ncbi:hypothetical protein WUBG_05652 [Wuchereria bancrofti]|uniref:Uncharacterized protein n=1 Tax=Wuchereria bancrofti TaxID=6293 RepID=J9F1V8_WUCBA|nr:hypothetical protein WUBG_05652 [Wuchereria bancrofti]